MANVTITQLPAAGPITGTESVPIVQNGQTVQATTAAIAAGPAQFQTFLTVNQEPTLANSRFVSAQTGIGITDNGAQSSYVFSLNGASGSLETALNGVIAKTGSTSVVARTLTASGAGLSITNGDGVSGNPTFSLTGMASSLANLSTTGLLFTNVGSVNACTIQGTANEISVANGTGATGDPTIRISDNPIIPGDGGVKVPVGTTAQRSGAGNGTIRYNTDLQVFEGYANGNWGAITTGAGVSSVDVSGGTTGVTFSGGPITTSGVITMGGTLNTDNGGTGLSSWVAGDLPYYATGTALSKLGIGTNGQVLTSTGTAPQWTTLSSVAITSINFDTTGLTPAIATTGAVTVGGTLVTSNGGTGVSSWTVGDLPYYAAGSALSKLGIGSATDILTSSGSAPQWSAASGVTVGTATNLAGGAAGSVPYQSGAGTSTFLNIGVANTVLTSSGTAPQWSNSLTGLTSVEVTQDPTQALQLATKQYVDSVAEGLHIHASCAAATPNTLASITGGSVTYNNGINGVGATLTLGVALTILDGYTLQNGDRVLVKNEATQANNGIYTWATGGTVLTRATDFDTSTEIASGDFTFVTNGTLYADTGWVQTNPVTTVGTSPVTFTQFSGAGTYTAGTGLTLTGSQFSITNTGVSAASYGTASDVPAFAVNAQGQLTSVVNTPIAIAGSQITSGTVAATVGGTGQSSYTTGDILYANSSTTLTKLTLGTQGQVLKAGASAPEWGAVAGGAF